MANEKNQYQPDYAVPPGWILEERLAAQGMAHAEFARRCGRSPKLISEVIAGKAPVEPRTALQFEKVLGVDASIWLGVEADYRLHEARESEAKEAAEYAAWAEGFPIRELVSRGVIRKPGSPSDTVTAVLSFFGVASREAWSVKYEGPRVAYRHSPSFKSDELALAAWLRLAEIQAEGQRCATYREPTFRRSLQQVRQLTYSPVNEALDEARGLLNEAGVALAVVKTLQRVRVSGAAWWLFPGRPLVALSARHLRDDHLWFSFFHEAAHILLHGKRTVFVDGTEATTDEVDTEANDWAARFLIPDRAWRRFEDVASYDEGSVRKFADEVGIAPGIVVGRLQHEGLVPWGSRLNSLKVKLLWADDNSD